MSSLYSLFDDLSNRASGEALACLHPFNLDTDVAIATEGELNDAMLFVEKGAVRVEAGGFEVTRMGPGAMIGEIGLFTHAVRTASVTTTEPTVVHALGRAAYLKLRELGNPVAFRIERRALEQLASRFHTLVGELQLASAKVPTTLIPARTTAEFGGHPMPVPHSRRLEGIRDSPAFEGASEASIEELAQATEARTFGAGDTLYADGRDDGPLSLLVHGEVDCTAPVGRARQCRIGTLPVGELFGLTHHIDERQRAFAYVASEPSTVLLWRQDAVRRWWLANSLTGSTLRTAMIRSLSDRVNQANAAYALTQLLLPPATS